MTSPAMFPTAASGGVLVASPSSALREQVRRSLQPRSWQVLEVSGGADALVKLESGDWQVLFLDRRLPDLDAEEVIKIIKVRFPGTEVVLLDPDGSPPPISLPAGFRPGLKTTAAEPVPESGAATPLPLRADELAAAVAPLPAMIGASPAMQRLYRHTRLVAPRLTTVLILGATGTGKELVARAIHQLSPRAVNTLQLPLDVSFQTVLGIPTAAGTTPDGFGLGAVAIDFDQNIAGGAPNVIYFMPDGTGQDVAGNINNGVIYIARAQQIYSSHAITFWGTTGRIRGWRLLTFKGNPYWGEM